MFVLFSGLSELFLILAARSAPSRLRFKAQTNSFFAKLILYFAGFELSVFTEGPPLADLLAPDAGVLLVSNHLSFWDVAFLASQVPTLFVTSVEVRDTAGLGWICRAAGCIFVERRNRQNIHQELTQMKDALGLGLNISLFPEGTSTDGEKVRPFKTSFFQSAVDSQKPVIPVCINYLRIDDSPLTPLNRDSVFYYGDQEFVPQLKKILSCKKTEVSLAFGLPIDAAAMSKHQAADLAHGWITSRYRAVK